MICVAFCIVHFDKNVCTKTKVLLFNTCFPCVLETKGDNDIIVLLMLFTKLFLSFSREEKMM